MGKGPRSKRIRPVHTDILVQDFPIEAAVPRDIGASFVAAVVGERNALIEKIAAAVPEVDFSDPAWGTLNIPGCRLEIHLGQQHEVTSFSLHVDGGEIAHEVVQEILERLRLRGIDLESGRFIGRSSAKRRRRIGHHSRQLSLVR
ncbi:MAG TPA: hypothetical protein VK473_11270 [Terriglobales bacterium]|nr:hypothetical protein [Terriglobales bacterium]